MEAPACEMPSARTTADYEQVKQWVRAVTAQLQLESKKIRDQEHFDGLECKAWGVEVVSGAQKGCVRHKKVKLVASLKESEDKLYNAWHRVLQLELTKESLDDLAMKVDENEKALFAFKKHD